MRKKPAKRQTCWDVLGLEKPEGIIGVGLFRIIVDATFHQRMDAWKKLKEADDRKIERLAAASMKRYDKQLKRLTEARDDVMKCLS